MSLAQCFSLSKYSEGFYIHTNTHMHLFIYGKASISQFCFSLSSLKTYQSLLEQGERGRELQVWKGGGYLLTGSMNQ